MTAATFDRGFENCYLENEQGVRVPEYSSLRGLSVLTVFRNRSRAYRACQLAGLAVPDLVCLLPRAGEMALLDLGAKWA
jgi:hypothetical protein